MSRIDWAAVIIYMAIITGVGVYFSRYMRKVADFFKGGNEIPWWLSGISMYMTGFSAFVFVAYAAMAYKFGFMAATLCWTAAPAYLIGAYFIAPRWRRTGIMTPVEYLESRYNNTIRQLFGWVGIPVRLIDDALKIVAMGTFIAVFMEVDIVWAMAALGAVVVVYCVIGGLWAVVITDMVQFVVLSVSLAIVVPLAVLKVGGLRQVVTGSPAGFFRFINPGHPEIGWAYYAVFFLLILLSYNSTWSMVQRSYCVKDERAARKASTLAAVLTFLTPPLWILPSICARQLLPGLVAEESFVRLCVDILPAGFLGVVLAGMFSATMSTLSSDYNIFAGVITEDIYHRLINRRASERRRLYVGRLSLLAVGAVGVGIAIYVESTKTGLFKWMAEAFGIALPPMAVPMIGGLFYRRTSARGCLATYFAGLTTAIALKFVLPVCLPAAAAGGEAWKAPFELFVGANILVSVAVFFGWGLVFPRRGAAEEARVAALYARVENPISREEIEAIERGAASGPSPVFITGVILCAIGVLLVALGFAPMSWAARGLNWGVAAVLIVLGFLGIRLRFAGSEKPEA